MSIKATIEAIDAINPALQVYIPFGPETALTFADLRELVNGYKNLNRRAAVMLDVHTEKGWAPHQVEQAERELREALAENEIH
jgi:hypothetical protein